MALPASDKNSHTLSLLRAYYESFSNNTDILPFAAQLYFLAEHWFTSGSQGQFIYDAFANAARDVQTNPTYRSYSAFPWYSYDRWFYPRTKDLQALGMRHLNDHIKPAYKENLTRKIEAGLKSGNSCSIAASQSIRALRSEHELFLISSVPYAIQKLREMGIITKLAPHTIFIQNNARSMRFRVTWEVLMGYCIRGQIPASEFQRLLHQSD